MVTNIPLIMEPPMSKKSLYLCISGIAFLVAAPAFAASIQMLPPVESTDPTQACTAATNSKILSWDGSSAIRCQAGVVVDNAGNVGIGITQPKTQLQVINGGGVGNIHAGGVGDASAAATYSSLTLAAGTDGNWLTNSWVLAHKKSGPTAGGLGISKFAGGGLAVDAVAIAQNGNVGIGVNTPSTKLDVGGAVKVGNDAAACSATTAGTIKWNGTSFKLCDGTGWKSLGTKRYSVTTAVISGNCPDAAVPNPDPWTSGYTGTTYVDMLYRWVNTCGARYCRALGEGYVTGKVTEYFGGNAEVDCW